MDKGRLIMEKKVIITPSSFGKCGNQPIELLEKNKFEIILNPFGRKMTSDEVIKYGEGCIGIIAGVESLNSKVLTSLSALRCISRVGVGIDNIDLECANELGITVKFIPNVATQAVAELTIGLMFDVLRKISFRDREIRKGNWNKEMGFLFKDKKIGIIGLGRIGKTVAYLSRALGAVVFATDINPDINWAKKNKVKIVKFNDIFKESNIISIHISSSPNNLSFIGKKELSQMKKGSYLINLSRGGIVDEEALYYALKNNNIAGAAVDVFNQEPYNGKLKSLDNVVLSSHVGSYAKESRLKMEMESVKNLIDTLNKTE